MNENRTFRTEYIWTREQRFEMWGEGLWIDEPDVCEWDFQTVRCFMRRHAEFGLWLGYIGLQPGHPWYAQDNADEPDACVHGGITFSGSTDRMQLGAAQGLGDAYDPSPTNEPLFWFGFDCSHGFDVNPGVDRLREKHGMPRLPSMGGTLFVPEYRHFRYVRDQTEHLAMQAIDVIRGMT